MFEWDKTTINIGTWDGRLLDADDWWAGPFKSNLVWFLSYPRDSDWPECLNHGEDMIDTVVNLKTPSAKNAYSRVGV